MSGFRFEREVQKIRGGTRLERLLSYYGTWKLPSHPHDRHLYSLVLRLAELRHLISVPGQGLESLAASGGEAPSVGELETQLRKVVAIDAWDKDIVGHSLAHCEILREIVRVTERRRAEPCGVAASDGIGAPNEP